MDIFQQFIYCEYLERKKSGPISSNNHHVASNKDRTPVKLETCIYTLFSK